MTSAITIERIDNIVVVRFLRAASDVEFEAYLAQYSKHLDDLPRLGAVFVTDPELPMTPARQVRLQARFMKERRMQILQRVVGLAFALPSPLMRGVLRAVLMLQAMPCPHTVLGTEEEGLAWVRARLWSDHLNRMKRLER
jgi:hypothetical protein